MSSFASTNCSTARVAHLRCNILEDMRRAYETKLPPAGPSPLLSPFPGPGKGARSWGPGPGPRVEGLAGLGACGLGRGKVQMGKKPRVDGGYVGFQRHPKARDRGRGPGPKSRFQVQATAATEIKGEGTCNPRASRLVNPRSIILAGQALSQRIRDRLIE